MDQGAIGGVVQTNTIVRCNADVMAVGRARTKTTETFLHRSQSLLVGENDGGRAYRGGNIESWSNLLCGQPKNKFQAKKKLQKSHVPTKKESTNGWPSITRHQGPKKHQLQ